MRQAPRQYLIFALACLLAACGRDQAEAIPDLPGGDPRQMKDSLKQLKQLPDEIRIFPGHGEDSTIGYEKATNFFMQ